MKRSSYMVGEIRVWTDPHGNPCAFEHEGRPVECVCQKGIRCAYHVHRGRKISRRVRGEVS